MMSKLFFSSLMSFFLLIFIVPSNVSSKPVWGDLKPPGNSSLVVDKRAVARVCRETPRTTELVCIGAYVTMQWVVASRHCSSYVRKAAEVAVYMGSSKMNCENGKKNRVREIKAHRDAVVIKLKKPFVLSKLITAINYRENPGQFINCSVFSAFKTAHEESEGCETIMMQHNFAVYSCGLRGFCGKVKTGGCTPCEPKHYVIGNSPVLCQNSLYGFVEKNANNFEKIKFRRFTKSLRG